MTENALQLRPLNLICKWFLLFQSTCATIHVSLLKMQDGFTIYLT